MDFQKKELFTSLSNFLLLKIFRDLNINKHTVKCIKTRVSHWKLLLPAPVYVVHNIFFHHKILLSPGNFVGFWVSSILITIALFFSAEFEYFQSIPFISFYQINQLIFCHSVFTIQLQLCT